MLVSLIQTYLYNYFSLICLSLILGYKSLVLLDSKRTFLLTFYTADDSTLDMLHWLHSLTTLDYSYTNQWS